MRERIVQLRKALKLTQSDFGKAIGLTASGISDVESGRRIVQERHVKLILSAFPNVSEKWLRTGEGDMFANKSDVEQIIAKYSFTGICEELMRTFAKLSPEDQEIVLNYTQGFLANLLSDRAAAEKDPDALDPEIEAEKEAYGRELLAEKMARTLQVSEGGNAGESA